MGSHYRLTCLHCGKLFDDPQEPFLLGCGENHRPALLRALYAEKRLTVEAQEPGLFPTGCLPIRRLAGGWQPWSSELGPGRT
jgi:hypothetical protein